MRRHDGGAADDPELAASGGLAVRHAAAHPVEEPRSLHKPRCPVHDGWCWVPRGLTWLPRLPRPTPPDVDRRAGPVRCPQDQVAARRCLEKLLRFVARTNTPLDRCDVSRYAPRAGVSTTRFPQTGAHRPAMPPPCAPVCARKNGQAPRGGGAGLGANSIWCVRLPRSVLPGTPSATWG